MVTCPAHAHPLEIMTQGLNLPGLVEPISSPNMTKVWAKALENEIEVSQGSFQGAECGIQGSREELLPPSGFQIILVGDDKDCWLKAQRLQLPIHN